MIQRLLDAGHSVFLPRVEGPDLVAVAYRIDVEMTSGAFGIPQPSGPPQDPATLDLVLVPGLAFTTDGRRLGQGGGYYDRFLTRIRPDCITAGIAFAEQLVGDVPTEPYDQTLTMIVTDAATESGR